MYERFEKKLHRKDFIKALEEVNTFMDITVDDLMDLNSRAEKFARMRATESQRVSSLMSQPVETVHPDCSLAEAAHLLITHKISGLPVVDDREKLVGIITEADFLRALGIPAHRPTHNLWQTLEALFENQIEIREPNGIVSDLMVRNVITVASQQTLHDFLEGMKKNRVKRLVVVDDARRVIGMVTRSDLVRVFFDRFV